jgi:hypothetical protein
VSLANELELEHQHHELEQARLEQEDEASKVQNHNLMVLQEAANVRMEQARRETETLLQRNTMLEKEAMDVDGCIRQQRANFEFEFEFEGEVYFVTPCRGSSAPTRTLR